MCLRKNGKFCREGGPVSNLFCAPYLPVLAYDVAPVADDNGGVPHCVRVQRIPLQNGTHHHHGVLGSELLAQGHRGTLLHELRKLAPLSLACAERKRHVERLLQAHHLHTRRAGSVQNVAHAGMDGVALVGVGGGGGLVNAVLDEAHAHDARRAQLLPASGKLVGLQVIASIPSGGGALRRQLQKLHCCALIAAVEHPPNLGEFLGRKAILYAERVQGGDLTVKEERRIELEMPSDYL